MLCCLFPALVVHALLNTSCLHLIGTRICCFSWVLAFSPTSAVSLKVVIYTSVFLWVGVFFFFLSPVSSFPEAVRVNSLNRSHVEISLSPHPSLARRWPSWVAAGAVWVLLDWLGSGTALPTCHSGPCPLGTAERWS